MLGTPKPGPPPPSALPHLQAPPRPLVLQLPSWSLQSRNQGESLCENPLAAPISFSNSSALSRPSFSCSSSCGFSLISHLPSALLSNPRCPDSSLEARLYASGPLLAPSECSSRAAVTFLPHPWRPGVALLLGPGSAILIPGGQQMAGGQLGVAVFRPGVSWLFFPSPGGARKFQFPKSHF